MWAVWKHGPALLLAIALALPAGCNLTRKGANVDDRSTDSPERGALKEAYAAFNRNDIPAAVEAVDPQVEWTEPAEFPGGGTYHGREQVRAYLSQSRANWAEGSSEPERFISAGDKIVVFVHVRARLKDSEQWQEARLADVFTFRNGKAVQMRAFADRRQALEWAGVQTAKAP